MYNEKVMQAFQNPQNVGEVENYNAIGTVGNETCGDIMQNNLRKLRKENNLTQVALQMQTGIEQALLSKFENEERIPPTESLMILADFYNVSIDYILCRTDKPEINR